MWYLMIGATWLWLDSVFLLDRLDTCYAESDLSAYMKVTLYFLCVWNTYMGNVLLSELIKQRYSNRRDLTIWGHWNKQMLEHWYKSQNQEYNWHLITQYYSKHASKLQIWNKKNKKYQSDRIFPIKPKNALKCLISPLKNDRKALNLNLYTGARHYILNLTEIKLSNWMMFLVSCLYNIFP